MWRKITCFVPSENGEEIELSLKIRFPDEIYLHTTMEIGKLLICESLGILPSLVRRVKSESIEEK